MDGWNDEKTEGVLRVMEEISAAEYELKNCIRGCYTGARTYKELSEYLQDLGQNLMDAAEDLSIFEEDDDEEEEYED